MLDMQDKEKESHLSKSFRTSHWTACQFSTSKVRVSKIASVGRIRNWRRSNWGTDHVLRHPFFYPAYHAYPLNHVFCLLRPSLDVSSVYCFVLWHWWLVNFWELKTSLSISRIRGILWDVHEAHIEDTFTEKHITFQSNLENFNKSKLSQVVLSH